jgi:nitroreductase
MSGFIELVKKRFSVRQYKSEPVDKEIILKILEAGRLAPSACNNQPWIFIVITKPEIKNELFCVYPKKWFIEAPVIVAACCDYSLAWHRSDGKCFGDIDVAISLDHITLMAAEFGIGTCWIGNFNAKKAKEVLRLPDNIEVIAFTPLGYPESSLNEKKRKPINQIVFWENYIKKPNNV